MSDHKVLLKDKVQKKKKKIKCAFIQTSEEGASAAFKGV